MAVSPGPILGTLMLVSIDGETILCSTSCTLTITNEEIETTCKDDGGAYTSVPGQQKWTMQVQGNIVYDNATGVRQLQELAMSKGTTQAIWGAIDNADNPYFSGDAFISSLTENGGQNAAATWDVTLSPRGPLHLFNT